MSDPTVTYTDKDGFSPPSEPIYEGDYVLAPVGSVVITPTPCEDCGGDGVDGHVRKPTKPAGVDYPTHTERRECSSCGGSGKQWPLWALDAIGVATLGRFLITDVLDALATTEGRGDTELLHPGIRAGRRADPAFVRGRDQGGGGR